MQLRKRLNSVLRWAKKRYKTRVEIGARDAHTGWVGTLKQIQARTSISTKLCIVKALTNKLGNIKVLQRGHQGVMVT